MKYTFIVLLFLSALNSCCECKKQQRTYYNDGSIYLRNTVAWPTDLNRAFDIDGYKHYYDVCGTGNLDTLKANYKGFSYVGSSYIYYINGVKNISANLTHFFIKQPK